MVLPRALAVEHRRVPDVTLPSEGGAPARLVTPSEEDMVREWKRIMGQVPKSFNSKAVMFVPREVKEQRERMASILLLTDFLNELGSAKLAQEDGQVTSLRKNFDPKPRQFRQQHEIDRHTQQLLTESPYVRDQFMKELYDAAKGPEKYEHDRRKYQDIFYNDVIGRFDEKLQPANPRTRKAYEADKWTGYEVVLDVFPDVIAYGILLLPKDLKAGEKRPVVVCQHGLEGRPQDTIGKQGYAAYKAFAAALANQGFITFAPQNLYIGHDKFRTLQRKANPLGKTLFSVIIPQHQQITDWLKTLPNVDGSRIGFYGLSYGGKSAMRIPAVVDNYCLSICSADFNEWVWKNASTRSPYSYVWSNEYEIFEWDLGSTFNYAEMAALIAPRPFMVERGHFDGVAPDETVGYEFAKVRHHYAVRLGLGDRCEIEWFVGPHTINGKGTFAFLHKHLKWP
jgi:hypothetical protein